MTGRPCVETIYSAVYGDVLDVKATACLRMRRPRRRPRQTRTPSGRPGLPNIADRPDTVDDRSEVGHWEADQITGAHNRSSMLSLTERVTRYSILVTMPNGYAAPDMIAVCWLDRIPAHLLSSITFDQGSEWANWPEIADSYGIDCWFCEPHSPWQRGQVENINRQWRWWFPAAPTSPASTQPTRTTPPTSSTANADAASTTRAPPPSTLPPPFSDHWNWPSVVFFRSAPHPYCCHWFSPSRGVVW